MNHSWDFGLLAHHFDLIVFFLLVILPILAALYCLYLAYRYIKAGWILTGISRSKIRSAPQGYVEFSAKVDKLHTELQSPLKKIPCVWYHAVIDVEKYESNGEFSHWHTIEEKKSTHPFLLRDETGECLIFPEKAVILCSHFDKGTDPKTGYRYREYRLECQDKVYATGVFTTININDLENYENREIKSLPDVIQYIQIKKLRTLDMLTDKGLAPKHEFVISALLEDPLIRRYRRNAILYILAFLFFCAAAMSSTYSTIKRSLSYDLNASYISFAPYS